MGGGSIVLGTWCRVASSTFVISRSNLLYCDWLDLRFEMG